MPRWGRVEWFFLACSGILHTVYFLVLLRGYRVADLTVVYPLARGSGPLLSSLVAVALLGEHLSLLGAAGIAAMVTGVFFVAGGPKIWSGFHAPEYRARIHKGIAWGLLTGFFIASYTVLDGYAVKVLLVSPVLLDYTGNLVRICVVGPQLLRDPPATRALWAKQRKYALAVGVISPVSYVLVLYAAQTAPLSHIAPAREVSMLFAALIGGQLLGEGDRLARVLGALLIGVGVVSLALG